MAKKQDAPAKPAKSASPSSMRVATLLFMFITLGIVMMPFAMLLAIGMLPSFVASMTDNRPEKSASSAIMIMNLCGIIPNLINLWNKGGTIGKAMAIVQDPFNLLMMYGAAGAGWLLVLAMPPIMQFLIGIKTEETLKQLRARMDKLREEWGDSIEGAVVEVSPDAVEKYQLQ